MAAVAMVSAGDARGRSGAMDGGADRADGGHRHAGIASTRRERDLEIVDIGASPFPYDDVVPETGGTPFLQKDAEGRSFHDAPRGGRLLADKAYFDTRSLLLVPRRFDPRAPAALVLFLHGNLATLARDVVGRQRVPEQVEASRANVLLVAPQLAVDALDSSAGRFWQQGFLQTYLRKAAERLAVLSGGRLDAEAIDRLPVILVAYSGGYLPAAFSLDHALSRGHGRIAGVVLLDALFGEEAKFSNWLAAEHAHTFFVSAYSRGSAALNARLEDEAKARAVPVLDGVPARIRPGDTVFQPALGAVHNDFVTRAWVRNPLQEVLARVDLAGLGHTP